MTVIICPACDSDLVETGKHHPLECVRCGNEFDTADAKVQEVGMEALYNRLQMIQDIREGVKKCRR